MKKLLTLAVLAASIVGASSTAVNAGFADSQDFRQDDYYLCVHTFRENGDEKQYVLIVNESGAAGHEAHGDNCFPDRVGPF